MLTAAVCAVIALIALGTTFTNTRERVSAHADSQALTWRQSLSATRGDWPWLATMSINLLFWVGMISASQFTVYYMTYNLQRPDLIPVVMGTAVVQMLTIALCPWLTKHWGVRPTVALGSLTTIAGTLGMMWVQGSVGFIALNIVAKLGMGLVIGLLFAMMSESVCYGEWKNGVRAQGFLFAASSFGVKLGMSIGGVIGAILLAWGNYVPNTAIQSANTLQWLQVGFIWVPVLTYVGIFASLMMYRFERGYSQEGSAPAVPVPEAQVELSR